MSKELESDSDKKNQKHSYYDLLNFEFSEKCISGFNDEEIDALFDTFYNISRQNETYIDFLKKLFDEKIKRKILKKEDKLSYKQILLDNRDFSKIRELLISFPGMIYLPKNIEIPENEETDGLVYDLKDYDNLAIKKIDISQYKKILIVSAFSCNFSERVLDLIFSDNEAEKIVRKYGVILFNDFSLDSLFYTKLHYAFGEIYLIYKEKNFKLLDLKTYPSIYFMDKGKVVYSIKENSIDFLEKFKKVAFENGFIINKIENRNFFHYDGCKSGMLSEILSFLSKKDFIEFSDNIEISRGIINKFDFKIINENHERNIDKICIYDSLTPLSIKKTKSGSMKLKDIRKFFNEENYLKVIKSLNISKGKIVGMESNFSLILNLPEKDKKYLMCELFGDCRE
ncbi:MAG: hypothetical protein AB1637_00345 [Elusimicrobiota bacterium]